MGPVSHRRGSAAGIGWREMAFTETGLITREAGLETDGWVSQRQYPKHVSCRRSVTDAAMHDAADECDPPCVLLGRSGH